MSTDMKHHRPSDTPKNASINMARYTFCIGRKLSTIVVYWPSTRPNIAFQSDAPEGSDTFRWQLWEEIASAGVADNMEQGKIPWYSHRLMHWKRVTSELHDSYFCLMMIKHAIPKILSGQLNYYITRWRQEVREFGDPLVTSCGREGQHPTEWASGPPVEQSRRMRMTHGYVQRGWGGQYVAVFVRSPTSSHTQTF